MAIDRQFEMELERLLSRHSVDNEVGCPDFLLAESIMRHLLGTKAMIRGREDWANASAPPPSPLPFQVD